MGARLPQRVSVTVGEDGILRAVYEAGADVTTRDAEEVLAWVDEQCREGGRPVLADTSSIRSMSREARVLFAEHRSAAAVGIVVKTAAARVIGNFFMRVNRPKVPMRLFSDAEAALEWLKNHL